MAARVFTADYAERTTLRNGTPVLLRLVVPGDMDLLRRGFERWSPESRYARFLAPKERLSEAELRYLCDVDQENHFALGAMQVSDDSTPVGLGIARFIRLPAVDGEPVTAEAAIAVADEAQHQGLGRMLFMRLLAAASERGIERFRCEVLGTNQTMQGLIDDVAPEHTTQGDSGVLSIDFALPHASATEIERTESAMYRFFRAAANGAVEWTGAAVRRFWRGT
jgi:GNAT superfamily N-acetyltransferase